jgi:LytS/YehU family sensor histidine kinase
MNSPTSDVFHFPGLAKSFGNRWLVYTGCQLLGWGGVAAFGWVMGWVRHLGGQEASIVEDQIFLSLTCLAGLVATHILWIIIRRGEWLVLSPVKIMVRYASALIITSLVLSFLGMEFFMASSRGESRIETFTAALMINTSLVGAWMAIYFLLHFYEGFHAARAEQALLKEAVTAGKLEALRLQLNPHFFFNALNSIRALIPVSNTEARHALTLMASVLRTTLGSSECALVPFSHEIELVRNYLAIEKIRFSEHLLIVENISPSILLARIPPLILLTLVENGIKHGVQLQESPATLAITAEVRDGEACISVENPASSASADSSLGLGLQNLRERLQLTFGNRSSAELHFCGNGNVRAELKYPAS